MIISSVTVKKLFEKKFKTVLHKDCIWMGVSSKQLTEKTIRSFINKYDNRLQNILLLIPESDKLFLPVTSCCYKTPSSVS